MSKKKISFEVKFEGNVKRPVAIGGEVQEDRWIRERVKESTTVEATSTGNAVVLARRQNGWPNYGTSRGGGWKGYEVWAKVYRNGVNQKHQKVA